MGFGDWLTKTFAASSKDILTGLGDVADRFIQTPEEKAQFQLELRKADMDLKRLMMEAEEMFIRDRQNARAMYEKDSILQKVFGIVFLVGYVFLSAAMVLIVLGIFGVSVPDINAFQASIISMVFTAMSTKVNTITDFLFGGSKLKDDSEQKMAQQFIEAAGNRPGRE
jgi:hypothetical protein